MQVKSVTSSNISALAFDDGTIYVLFTKGSVYAYAGASESDFRAFCEAPSVGQHFHAMIKDKLVMRKLSADEAKAVFDAPALT